MPASRKPRRLIVRQCYDCGWVGNRPEWHKGVQYFMEEPWDEPVCPECGECAGPDFDAIEVMPLSYDPADVAGLADSEWPAWLKRVWRWLSE